MPLRLLALATLLALTTVSAQAADWSRFRGPNGNAFSEEKGLPTKWSDSAQDGLVWKTSLPGAGSAWSRSDGTCCIEDCAWHCCAYTYVAVILDRHFDSVVVAI